MILIYCHYIACSAIDFSAYIHYRVTAYLFSTLPISFYLSASQVSLQTISFLLVGLSRPIYFSSMVFDSNNIYMLICY